MFVLSLLTPNPFQEDDDNPESLIALEDCLELHLQERFSEFDAEYSMSDSPLSANAVSAPTITLSHISQEQHRELKKSVTAKPGTTSKSGTNSSNPKNGSSNSAESGKSKLTKVSPRAPDSDTKQPTRGYLSTSLISVDISYCIRIMI